MAVPNSVHIATVKKNETEEVRVTLDIFKGRRIFNARVFFDAGGGEMRPTKAGIALRMERVEAFAEAVTQALMTSKAKGYLP